MLQIVLGVIIGVLTALGIGWFVRKYKGQIREILSKYLCWIFGTCFPLLTGLLIGTLISNKGEELGSWADWASALGTVDAFIWGIIVITKQTNIQRAMNIENKRPRFSYEKTKIILKGDMILCSNENQSLNIIKKRLEKNDELFRISNVSENPIYSMKIISKYNTSEENEYIFHGLSKGKSVVLIPTNLVKDWQEIFIRFRSSASEVGYMRCQEEKKDINKNTHYYFVKDRNTAVYTYGDDELVSPDDKIVQDFDEMFDDKKASGIKFVAFKNIH